MDRPPEEPSGERWYTPDEAARRLQIAYNTVLRYAREHADELEVRRSPRQRALFSEKDIEILRQHLKRPRGEGLTVAQMAAQLRVPSFRLRRLVEQLEAILPKPGAARPGLYAPAAVEILRRQLLRDDRKKEPTSAASEYWRAAATLRVASGQLSRISRDLKTAYSRLRNNPPAVTAYIHVLAAQEWHLAKPIAVVVSPHRRNYWRASLPEAKLQGIGPTIDDAVLALQATIVSALRDPETPGEQRAVLQQLVRRRGRKKA